MKFNLEKALNAIADYEKGEAPSKYVYQARRERYRVLLPAFEFSDDQEKERILTYMKSIALGAQQERDFLPTRQWNKEIDDYERVIDSDSWDAGTTLVRLLGYRTGRSLSTKTLQTHRDFIALVVRDFCAQDEINWMWNGHNGLDRAYELEGFGNLAKVIAFTRATGEVARCRSVLGQASKRVEEAQKSYDDAIATQLASRAALRGDVLPDEGAPEPAVAC
tara:strand:+ start:40 stop:702 length:663 start_codon:yes stop_codon:yes gene_type:complete